MQLKLITPFEAEPEALLALREELRSAGDRDAFAGCGGLGQYADVKDWLARLRQLEDPLTCPADKVPSRVWLSLRPADGRLVGVIDLRYHIDHPVLGLWGGHIGYCIRPTERGRGYAAEQLRLVLAQARARGLPQVMVTCSEENLPSARTILACGGVYERTVAVEDERIRRYWIDLKTN